jgi:flagellar biosynthetic protein FlhB
MAMFDSDNGERTESATAHRREEFRKQGTVALSREVLSISLLFFVGVTFYFASHSMFEQFAVLAGKFFNFTSVPDFGKKEILELKNDVIAKAVVMVIPVFIAALVIGILTCAAQVGFYITWEPLSPKWERLNPITGFQRLLSLQGTAEAVKAPIKIAIAGFVVWGFLKANAVQSAIFFQKSVPEINSLMFGLIGKLFVSLILYLLFVAILDYAFQRYQLEQQMKMTKREAKEEFKLREGDPLIKSRIRSIQRRIASRRMMDAVPKATVIVTNPTHLAVALLYDGKSMAAPKVVAKGAGIIAEKIREIARFNRVPIVENKPLARTLYKTIDIGKYIPKELYKAVAEVLAYVYRLKGAPAGAAA